MGLLRSPGLRYSFKRRKRIEIWHPLFVYLFEPKLLISRLPEEEKKIVEKDAKN